MFKQNIPDGTSVRLKNSVEEFGMKVTGQVDGYDDDVGIYLVRADQDTGDYGFTGECEEQDLEVITPEDRPAVKANVKVWW